MARNSVHFDYNILAEVLDWQPYLSASFTVRKKIIKRNSYYNTDRSASIILCCFTLSIAILKKTWEWEAIISGMLMACCFMICF